MKITNICSFVLRIRKLKRNRAIIFDLPEQVSDPRFSNFPAHDLNFDLI